MIRVQSENQSLHEATLKSLKEQHRREIKCLQEELSSERNKYNSTFSSPFTHHI